MGEKDAADGMADLWKNHVSPGKADAAGASTSPAAEPGKDGEATAAGAGGAGADSAVDPLQAAASKKDGTPATQKVVYGRKLAPADLKR